MNNRLENFKAGFIRENPIFGLYLGLCSTLAISTTLNNAIGMGVAVTAVLIMSNVIISMIRKITPDEIRIPVYIVVIAALVKSVQLLIQAYAQDLYSALGIFLPLIVVNCIILGRAEAFASKNSVVDSALDGLGMGLGYTAGLFVMAVIRQILSTGGLSFANPMNPAFIIFEAQFFPAEYAISLFKEPVGAFLTFACLAGALTCFKNTENKKPWKIGALAVVVVLVAGVALTGNFMINTAAVVEEPSNEVVNNAEGNLNADSSTVTGLNAEIVSTEEVDGATVYYVNADGFQGTNEFKVTVKNGAVEAVEIIAVNDTPGIGTQIEDADFLAQFNGADSTDFSIDAKSGATISSSSAYKAVLSVLEDLD